MICTCFSCSNPNAYAQTSRCAILLTAPKNRWKNRNRRKNMTASVMAIPAPEELVNKWLESLEADDHARGTIRRYKSAALSFLSWYEQKEYRPLTLERLSPITLVG